MHSRFNYKINMSGHEIAYAGLFRVILYKNNVFPLKYSIQNINQWKSFQNEFQQKHDDVDEYFSRNMMNILVETWTKHDDILVET